MCTGSKQNFIDGSLASSLSTLFFAQISKKELYIYGFLSIAQKMGRKLKKQEITENFSYRILG